MVCPGKYLSGSWRCSRRMIPAGGYEHMYGITLEGPWSCSGPPGLGCSGGLASRLLTGVGGVCLLVFYQHGCFKMFFRRKFHFNWFKIAVRLNNKTINYWFSPNRSRTHVNLLFLTLFPVFCIPNTSASSSDGQRPEEHLLTDGHYPASFPPKPRNLGFSSSRRSKQEEMCLPEITCKMRVDAGNVNISVWSSPPPGTWSHHKLWSWWWSTLISPSCAPRSLTDGRI